MTCQYCRARIDTDAHRCDRCGRRYVEPRPVQMTAAVPDLRPMENQRPPQKPERPGPQLVPAPVSKRADQSGGPQFQRNLFGPVEVSPAQKEPAGPATRRTAPRPRRDSSRQQQLGFHEPHTLSSSAGVSLYCDAPVAATAHRMIAGAVDIGLALGAIGAFLLTLHFTAADLTFTKVTMPTFGLAAALIILFYRLIFCAANADTPGTVWTGLQVVDFDGRPPTSKQRWFRLLSGCVSAIAAGIGFAWALVDEERLTWHDRMSNTFATPRFFDHHNN